MGNKFRNTILLKLLLLLLTLFVSCDTIRHAVGYVYDKETHIPLEGVKIYSIKDSSIFFVTDTSGMWEVFSSSRFVPKNNYNVKLSKPGYVEKELNMKDYTDSIIVYLEKPR